jgi:hypothetical protein
MTREPADLLNQFRRKPYGAATGTRLERTDGLRLYEACKVSSHPPALAIYPMLGPAHNPTYSYLFNVSWDDEIFETIVLFFTFMQVNIRGRALAPVVDALRLRKCEFIREFHPKAHVPPAEGEPVITAIEFVVKDLPAALSENVAGKAAR